MAAPETQPIRIGFIGLSTQPFPQGWSQATHLPYLKANPVKYTITALLNSTLASSEAAIEKFGLSDAKAFGDLEEFTSCPDIDLVVCCTDVARHFEPVKAALEHGKHVFVEWPLTRDVTQARELVKIAEEKKLRTFTCLETPLLPVTFALRNVIDSGRIGNLISTNFHAVIPPTGPAWAEHVIFYLQLESGQTPLHCRVAHPLDAFLRVVGEFDSFKSELLTHQKSIRLYDTAVADLGTLAADYEAKPYRVYNDRTAPDDVLVQGRLTSGAVASLHFHTGADFFNPTDGSTSNLRWIIHGTEGDVYITQTSGALLLRDWSVKIHVVKGGKAEEVPIGWEEKGDFAMFGEYVVLATPGRHYRAIAEAWDKEEWNNNVVDFRKGLERLEMLEKVVKGGSSVVEVKANGIEAQTGTATANGNAENGNVEAHNKMPGVVRSASTGANGNALNGAAGTGGGEETQVEAKKKRRKSSIWKIIGLQKG